MDLRYGINPEHSATATVGEPGSPVRLVAGEPSYINLLDALNAWQLVRDGARSLAEPGRRASSTSRRPGPRAQGKSMRSWRRRGR